MDIINEFTGKYFFLSNYYSCIVRYNRHTFKSSEAAFHAQKNPNIADSFVDVTPNRAKYLGRRVELRDDWEDVKLNIMKEILISKFSDKTLRNKLIKTYPCTLIEGTTWGDTFWGVDVKTGEGENHLGKLLMEIRDDLMKGE